jgi:hypothetical protein
VILVTIRINGSSNDLDEKVVIQWTINTRKSP